MMIDKKTRSEADSELRWQAEEMARGKAGQPSQDPVDLSPEGTWRLLHELSVHQIELEIQNEELRRMQIELERARERYFNLYDLAPVGYFTLSENGLILEANLTAAGLLGVTRSALVNHSFSRFVIAEDQQSYYQNRKRLVETGEPQNYELRMMRQEPSTTKGTVSHSSAGICGTTFWAQLVATVTQDAAGTPVCRIVISDITERKLTETTLRESQEQTLRSETRLKKAQSVARVGDWVWNIKESQVEWSGEMYSIFGIDNSSYTGRLGDAITQVIHPDDLYIVLPSNAATFVEKKPVEYRIIWPDGSIRHIWAESGDAILDEAGKPIYLTGIAQDITERKLAEEALIASEAVFSSAFKFAAIGMALVSPDGHWLKINQALCQMLEYRESELIDLTFQDITHPDDLTLDLEYVGKMLNGEISTYQMEKRYIQKSGNVVWALLSVSLIRNSDTKPLFFISQVQDISEHKLMEDVQIFLAKTGGSGGDDYFFNSLARFLAQSLTMDFVCIDRLEGDGLNARTLAVWSDGHFEDNITYALKDTPCGDVVGNVVCCFPASVGQFFPRDQVLQDLRAESYVGVTLFSHSGQPIGLIAVIGRQPLKNRPLTEAVLKLVAVRASSELERLAIESELRESNERYRSSFLQSSAIKLLVEPETGNIIDANQAALDFYGYSNEQLCKMDIHQINIDMPVEIRKKMELVGNGQETFFHFNHRLASGEIRDVEVYSSPILVKGKKILHSIIHDVTQRKLADDILRASVRLHMVFGEKDLQGMLQAGLDIAEENTGSQVGFFHFLEPDQETLNLQAWSTRTMKEFCRAEGLRDYEEKDAGVWADCIRGRGPVVHNNYLDLPHRKGMPPGHTEVIRELVVPVFEGEIIVAIMGVGNKPTPYRDRDIAFLQEFSRLCWDLVQIKKQAFAIITAEERLRSILSSTPEMVFSINADCEIEFINKVPVGFNVAQAIGANALSFVAPEDQPLALAKIQAVFQTGQPGHNVVKLNGDYGQGVWYESHLAPLFVNGNVKSVVISTTDISGLLGMQQALEESNQALVTAYEATLEGWAKALELRERETAGHSARVVKLTLAMARELGIEEVEMSHIHRGALLHDIGKIGIPDNILLKPGPLSEDEWVIMRQHPLYAQRLLSPIKYLKPAMDIPYYHHEKWDGSGYPIGLKGEEIPLVARIFAIVDVYDALAYDRPYRPAWEKESIIQYLRDQTGKYFDPQVVDAFLRLVSRRD